MNKLAKLIKKRKLIVFLDLEGTQLSHEMIAIGAIKCTINSKGRIKKYGKTFKQYVKAKNKVGKVVNKLTGISDELLKEKGINFNDLLHEFKKFVGIGWKNALFVTFGNHDYKIITQSVQYNFSVPSEISSHILKNYLDFLSIISEYVKDKDNNPYSLINYCHLFGVSLAEPAHDPCNDAINLAKLYDAFLQKKDIVFEEYKKVLAHSNHLPEPIKVVIKQLAEGHDVQAIQFDEVVKKYLND